MLNMRNYIRSIYFVILFTLVLSIIFLFYMLRSDSNTTNDFDKLDSQSQETKDVMLKLHFRAPNNYVKSKSSIQDSKNITIISYSNDVYYSALRNFVGSVHFWEPHLQIVVFNLGMLEEQLNDVRKWRNTKLVNFNFSLYQDYVKDLHKYAFKPIIVNETFHEYGFIFIEDAGQEFRQPITKLKDLIKRDGFLGNEYYGMDLTDTLKLTHPGTMKYLNITLKRRHCQGGIVGMYRDHPEKKQDLINFLEEYASCAKVEECIAPEGATLANHRFDQVVQTLLVQKYHLDCNGGDEIGCEVLGFGSHPPLTSDPTEVNDIIVCSRKSHQPKPYAKYLQNN